MSFCYKFILYAVTVITQPDNITICDRHEGGTAVFTCAMYMDILNVNKSLADVKWWRIRTDLTNDSVNVTINTYALARLSVNNSISQDTCIH